MRTPSIAEHLAAISRALDAAKIAWYVFGAQAVIAAGAIRQTADLDITTADVPVKVLERVLSGAGFVRRKGIPGIADLIAHHRILPLTHGRSGLPLDVVRAGPGLEEQMLARAIRRRVGRRSIPFVDTNDLLVLKVLAARPKDLEDVRALLRGGSTEIDLATTRARLRELGQLLDDSTLVEIFEEQVKAARRKKKT